MIISRNWLQTYFKEKLPSADKIAELLIFHAFEVESVEKQDDDFIFDIKVLPDRAHDCLSHRGIARELAVHLGTKILEKKKLLKISDEKANHVLYINVLEPGQCPRYTGLAIEGITVSPSPDWLKDYLESIGQKSINNIVDATNFVMFDLGQPLHAFDADKIDGAITVRNANSKEKITTLDGKELVLDEDALVITDDKEPLAIAGIKGGKRAEVDTETKNIILEAANFFSTGVRKTSKHLGIQTDSSKRFENELSPEKTKEAIEVVANLILEIAGDGNTKVGDIIDVYPRRGAPYVVGISAQEVSRALGISVSQDEVESIFKKFDFTYRIVKPAEEVVSLSQNLAGIPYKFGASVVFDAPNAFDCSSFIAYLFAQSGVAVPRMAVDQYAFGARVEVSELKPGDVVFSNTGVGKIYYETVGFMRGTKIPQGVDHCGLYMGDGKVIHATRHQGKVVMEELASSEQFKNIVGYGRMVDKEDQTRLAVTIPHERLDIRIKENLIEEIGRTYGYDKIPALAISAVTGKIAVNKPFFYANKIRDVLVREGFSEVYTSSFMKSGNVAVENPIATDKGFLRNDLRGNLLKSLELNFRNAPLLGLQSVKIFEIGRVFKKISEEKTILAIGVEGKKSRQEIEKIVEILTGEIGSDCNGDIKYHGEMAVMEIDMDTLIGKLPQPVEYAAPRAYSKENQVYQKISLYPFISRDIAVWTPTETKESDVLSIINKKAGELLVRTELFDVFEKEGRISYAFRLVFQSRERTLTDDEVNIIMETIAKTMNSNPGWEVR
ncbi:MAG: phenylalanine--tRNA ligase beta subunit-related protein [Patescibacteria group bacterium]|nr:phenylalanine--tRNA ligase beta subunit-related protein [Patescibacteria group bacterium]